LNDAANWYALYTKARHEKVVHASLCAQGVEAFLPLHDVLSQWKDRRKWVQMPLFPGYLFARLPADQLWVANAVRGVVHLVGDGERPVPVPEEQVLSVRRLLERPVPTDPWPYMREGDRVLVRSGPLMGLEGYFVRHEGASKLVISVDLLGRSVAAQVDADSVVPVDMPRPLAFARSRLGAARPLGLLGLAVLCLLALVPALARGLSGRSVAAPTAAVSPTAAVAVRAGVLQGRLLEPDMATPLAGVSVVLRSGSEEEVAAATTDADGRFVLSGFGPGQYVLHAGSPGVETPLAASEDAADEDVQIVMASLSLEPVPPGAPEELSPRPLPVAAVRSEGRLVLVADPFSGGTAAGAVPKWSRPYVGRTTF